MKRLLIGFLIVIISLMMFVSCDSDDDDDDKEVVGITQPPTNDWIYGLSATFYDVSRNGFVYVQALDENNIIDTCTVSIDNEPVDMYYLDDMLEWHGDFVFEPGETYLFALDVNNGQYSQTAQLMMPYIPVLEYDMEWDGSTSTQLNWELEAGAQAQSLLILGPDDTSEPIEYLFIDPALRAYTLAAGLHGYNDFETEALSVSVDEDNWVFSNNLLFLAYTYNDAIYGTYDPEPRAHARRIGHHLMSQIR